MGEGEREVERVRLSPPSLSFAPRRHCRLRERSPASTPSTLPRPCPLPTPTLPPGLSCGLWTWATFPTEPVHRFLPLCSIE